MFTGTGRAPDVAPPRVRGELRGYDSGLAVLVARRPPARTWILRVDGCATVTVDFAGLSCWLLIEARDGAGDLGMVERLTSAVQGLFPLVVAIDLRQTARHAGNERQRGQDRFRTLAGICADRPKDTS
jgi:hypothetical protein